jgi:hypothetical protein
MRKPRRAQLRPCRGHCRNGKFSRIAREGEQIVPRFTGFSTQIRGKIAGITFAGTSGGCKAAQVSSKEKKNDVSTP